MKINSFRIENLYSFEDEKVDFVNFNIIVGPNGGGKTNIIRSFKTMINKPYISNKKNGTDTIINEIQYSSLPSLQTNFDNLLYSAISPDIKLNKENKSAVMLEFQLSKDELKLLFEFIFKKDIEIENIQNYDNGIFTLFINWPVSYGKNIRPDVLIFRFPNGFTFLYEQSSWHNILYTDQNLINNFFNANDTTLDIFKKIKDDYCNEANFNNGEIKEYLSQENTPLVIHNEIYNEAPNIFSVIPTYSDFMQRVREKLHNNEKFINSMLNSSIDIKKILSVSYKLYKSSDHNENNAVLFPNKLCLLLPSDELENFKFSNNFDKKYISDIYSVLFNNKIDGNGNIQNFAPNIWVFLSNLIFSKIILSNEIPDNEETLAEKLFIFKNKDGFQKNYEELKNGFQNIFGKDLGFDVTLSTDDKSIKIKEKEKDFKLSDSASGYFDVLSLLTTISNQTDCVLMLDEPLTRLHHSKQRLMGDVLLRNENSNQIIIVTHSPSFVNYEIIRDNKLIYVKRNGNNSRVFKRTSSDEIPKSHLINPDIFFSNYVIAVEGATDEAVFKAISDFLSDLFWKSDVLILNMQSKNNSYKFGNLMYQYGINFLLLVDHDFDEKGYFKKHILNKGKFHCYPFENNKSDKTKSIYVISDKDINMDKILDNLGYAGKQKDTCDYYDFIYDIMKKRQKIEYTLLFEIINKIKKDLNIQ